MRCVGSLEQIERQLYTEYSNRQDRLRLFGLVNPHSSCSYVGQSASLPHVIDYVTYTRKALGLCCQWIYLRKLRPDQTESPTDGYVL